MRLKILLLLLIGALATFGSGLLTLQYARTLEGEAGAARAELARLADTVEVPVPVRDIARNARIGPEDFTTLRISAQALPENVLRGFEGISAPPAAPSGGPAGEASGAEVPDSDAAGAGPAPVAYVALRELGAGQLVLRTDIGIAGGAGGFILSEDGRAFALAAENLAEMAATLVAGDRLDVYWTRPHPETGSETRLLGAGLLLLDLTPPAGSGPGAVPASVMIEGLAPDVARLVHARQEGRFHIAPARSSLDMSAGEIVVDDAMLAQLPLLVREVPAPEPAAPGSGPRNIAEDAALPAAVPDSSVAIPAASPGPEQQPATVPADFLSQLTPGGGQPPRCSLAIVRSAQRMVVEVPC